MDVQVQWAHFVQAFQNYDGTLTGTYPASMLQMGQDYTLNGVVSGAATSSTSPAVLDTNSWVVRARAGNATTGVWGRWSSVARIGIYAVQVSGALYIDENVGQSFNAPRFYAAAYIDENVGISDASLLQDAMYVNENVGVHVPYPLDNTAAYFDENVGPDVQSTKAATAYIDMDVDSSQHPVPYVWWIVPVQGREGWLFHVFGHGFGDSQAEYNGEVLLNDLSGGILVWERVPASLAQNELELTIQPGTTIGSQLKLLLAAAPGTTFSAGDKVVWEEYWDAPGGENLGFGLSFVVGGIEYGSFTDTTRTDDNGAKLQAGTDRTPAYKSWLSHSYTIQAADGGDAVGAFYVNLVTQYLGQVAAVVRIRNVGVMDGSTGVVTWWAVPPTVVGWAPGAPLVAQNGSKLSSQAVLAPDIEIDPGTGLSDQTILPEHGHIVVSVPSGAETGPVKVRLTT